MRFRKLGAQEKKAPLTFAANFKTPHHENKITFTFFSGIYVYKCTN